jgi:small GTP-binding protein
MAIPHIIQMQIIRERLKNKDGKARLQELENILDGLPRYNTGPYGEIRKWLHEEVQNTRTRSKIKHQDWLGVKRQGMKQFVLVGAPNVGKSSLLNKLSGIQIKIANYEFTTLKPQPAIIDINGAEFQIIDLPGLIEGAVDDIGGGKRLIGIVKNSDGIILMHDLTKTLEQLDPIVKEIQKARIEKPTIIIGSKFDIANASENFEKLKMRFPNDIVIAVSIVTGQGVSELEDAIWDISNLIRVYSKGQEKPMILSNGSTLREFVEKIHRGLSDEFLFARVTGKSAKYRNQQLGLNHELKDKDAVEAVFRR